MPQIKPPAVKPMQSDIQRFARAYFNLDLTKAQLEVIDAMAKGKTLIHKRRQTGSYTARSVAMAYLAEGLKPGGRARLPQQVLPAHLGRSKVKGATQEGRVLNMIKRPGGAFNFELSRIALKYTSVISALRKEGHDIIAERQYLKNGKASNTFRYRIGGQ